MESCCFGRIEKNADSPGGGNCGGADGNGRAGIDAGAASVPGCGVILQRYEAGDADWHVEAERGFAAPSGDSLRLSGNVALLRQREDGDSLTLTTSMLDVDLAGEILSTDEPVQMIAGGLRQDAAGLVLNLPEDSLLMLGGVRGSHVRP